MSLSSMSGVTTSPLSNWGNSAGQSPQVQPAQVPGIPAGKPPVTTQQTPVNLEPKSQSTSATGMSVESVSDQLEQFKQNADNTNGQGGSDQGNPALEDMTIPEVTKFKDLAHQLTSNLQIDDELAAKALQGDVASLKQLLTGSMEQAAANILHTGALTSLQISNHSRQRVATEVMQQQQGSKAETAAMEVATKAVPAIQDPDIATLASSKLKELRKQYPTAPAELLGKQLAYEMRKFASFGTKPEEDLNNFNNSPRQANNADWSEHFNPKF